MAVSPPSPLPRVFIPPSTLHLEFHSPDCYSFQTPCNNSRSVFPPPLNKAYHPPPTLFTSHATPSHLISFPGPFILFFCAINLASLAILSFLEYSCLFSLVFLLFQIKNPPISDHEVADGGEEGNTSAFTSYSTYDQADLSPFAICGNESIRIF